MRTVKRHEMAAALACLWLGFESAHAELVPDPTFGTNGVQRTSFGGEDSPRDLLIQPDGKLLSADVSSGAAADRFVAMVRLFPWERTPSSGMAAIRRVTRFPREAISPRSGAHRARCRGN